MKPKIHHPLFAISLLVALFATTGCETIESTFYEPVPYDEVAAANSITLEEAEALGIVRPKSSIAPLIEATTSFIPAPGAAPLTSLVLNGALAIGAIWLGKKKRTAEKVTASLVQGIDTFRDVLDQTPQGGKIDASLTKTLKDHQHALRVQQEVHKLLERYATPTKEPIRFEDPA
jgi:hypothetical protein